MAPKKDKKNKGTGNETTPYFKTDKVTAAMEHQEDFPPLQPREGQRPITDFTSVAASKRPPPPPLATAAVMASARTVMAEVNKVAASAAEGSSMTPVKRKAGGSGSSEEGEAADKRADLKDTPPQTANNTFDNDSGSDTDASLLSIASKKAGISRPSSPPSLGGPAGGTMEVGGGGVGGYIPPSVLPTPWYKEIIRICDKYMEDKVTSAMTGFMIQVEDLVAAKVKEAEARMEANIMRAIRQERDDYYMSEKSRRSIIVYNMNKWDVDAEYYGNAPWEDVLSEDISYCCKRRVTVQEVHVFRPAGGPGGDGGAGSGQPAQPTSAKVVFGSAAQKYAFYRLMGAATKQKDCPFKQVSFRDCFPAHLQTVVATMNSEGQEMKKDWKCAAYRIVARGLKCEPVLEIRNGSGPWTIYRSAAYKEVEEGRAALAAKRQSGCQAARGGLAGRTQGPSRYVATPAVAAARAGARQGQAQAVGTVGRLREPQYRLANFPPMRRNNQPVEVMETIEGAGADSGPAAMGGGLGVANGGPRVPPRDFHSQAMGYYMHLRSARSSPPETPASPAPPRQHAHAPLSRHGLTFMQKTPHCF